MSSAGNNNSGTLAAAAAAATSDSRNGNTAYIIQTSAAAAEAAAAPPADCSVKAAYDAPTGTTSAAASTLVESIAENTAKTHIKSTEILSSMSSSSPQTALPITVHYLASFHQICVITALLPLVTLFTCFVTAYIFQYDDVHETHCRVYNIIPSISAITGVSPQRYFWRFSIALHIGPRIPIAFVYKNYYRSQLSQLAQRAPGKVALVRTLITLIHVMNCIEIAALGGVTYISNRENYPIHEKIFITFMICSLCYMLATIKLNSIMHEGQALSNNQCLSIKWKKILFAISILSTIGLLIFFAKHRFYCHDMAFSWFAFFEYCIAIANMLFHFTIIWDFPSQYMLIVQGSRTTFEQYFNETPSKLNKKQN